MVQAARPSGGATGPALPWDPDFTDSCPLLPFLHPGLLGVSDDPPVRCSRLEPWREASLSAPPSAAVRQTLRGLRGGRCLVLRAPRLLRRDLQIAQIVLIML